MFSWLPPYNTMLVLIGTSLLGACSGMVGSFAVLRRRALAGDALAHAALPGVCLAFLILQQRSLPWLLFGALCTGILGILVISALQTWTRVKEDAAIGIVLSVFYGAGVVLLSFIQRQKTTANKAGLESFILGKTAGMIAQDVYLIAAGSLFSLLLIVLLYKEFQLVAFDPGFASVQGWPAFRIDLLLMAMISLTVVIGLPAVGVVLMAAALIIPAATARFWTERLGMMLFLSALVGLLTGILGSIVGAKLNYPAGPSIVLAGTFLFVLSMLFAPKRGTVARLYGEFRFRRKIAEQRTLERLFLPVETHAFTELRFPLEPVIQKHPGHRNTLQSSLKRLIRKEYFHDAPTTTSYEFTSEGLRKAAELTRARRLWELFLTEHAELAGDFRDLDHENLAELLPQKLQHELTNLLREQNRDPVIALENSRLVRSTQEANT